MGDCEHKIMEMLFIPIRSQVLMQLLVAGFSKIVMTFSSRKRLPWLIEFDISNAVKD